MFIFTNCISNNICSNFIITLLIIIILNSFTIPIRMLGGMEDI